MDGISQYQRPGAILVPKARNPWEELAPNLINQVVGGAIMSKLKQKFEQEPLYKQQEALERMKEEAASARQKESTRGHLLGLGWREGQDGQLIPPSTGSAGDAPQIPGYTPYYQDGKLLYQKNNPTMDVVYDGQTYRYVNPDTALQVQGQVGIAGMKDASNTKGQYTIDQIIGDTRSHYQDRQKGIDTKYGTRNAFGDFSVDEKVRSQWEAETQANNEALANDLYSITTGRPPGWLSTQTKNKSKKTASDTQVDNFINSFNFSTFQPGN